MNEDNKMNSTNTEDKLYQLLHEALDQQRDIIKSNTDAMSKYSSSMDETMLILDNRFEQESKEKMETMKHMSTENRKTVLWTAGIISASFTIIIIGYLLIYFLTPFEVSSTATANAKSSSVSISEEDTEDVTLDENIDLDESDTGGEYICQQ